MKPVFDAVLDMSIQASWIILAVIAARFFLKSAPKWLRCGLWALVALRLLCPVSLESGYSLVPDSRPITDQLAQQTLPEPIQNIHFSDLPAGDHMSVTYTDRRGEKQVAEVYQEADGDIVMVSTTGTTAADLLPWLWLSGVAVFSLYAAVSYFRLKKRIGPALHLENGVFLCDYIDSPFILGIVKPKIYLPSDLEPESAQYVLAHEKAHLKRRDHWWKPLGYCLLCIHWFNPLVWIAYILLCRDIELACDEKVIRVLGGSEKKAYSEALLRCSVSHKQILACPLAFGEVGVKQRVKSVLSYKKPGFWILLVSLILVCALSVGFLTDPERDTLSDLCPVDRESVTCIDLWSDKGHCCMGFPEFLEKTWALLDQVEYDTLIQTDVYDPLGNYPSFTYFVGDETTRVYLNEDYSQLIPDIAPDAETYEYYSIKDPGALKAFFDDHIAIVYNQEVTAEPFAQLGQPYVWMQGLTSDAMASVRTGYSNSTNSSTGGNLSLAGFEELCALLKTIPEDALINPEIVGSGGSDHITTYYSVRPNMAISFQDEANDLGVVVRYYEKADGAHLEIVMIDGADSVSPDNRGAKILQAHKWDIDSPALLNWFRQAAEYPPSATLRYGHWMPYDEERGIMEVSDGTSTIKVRSFAGWTYEIVEPSEDRESFGVRCRHPEQTEGWIYISFWPDGYSAPQHNRYVNSNDNGYYSYPLTVLYPNGTDPEGAVMYESVNYYENGDVVILNEGADHWYPDCAKDIEVQTTYIWEDAGERITKDPPEVTIDVEYTQCDDWSTDFVWFQFDTADPTRLSLTGWEECGWVHDETPEGENALLAYWPEYETEGMVCIEYHEGFFQPPENMAVEETTLHIDSYGPYPAYQGTLSGEERWSYLWIDRKNGSYVFRFENTAHWTDRKIEECLWALHTLQIRG